ncbi:MAG: nicotinamide phosphoribosyltransferase domain-containing protein [Candidatus Woesearchaeota archaeon]
MTTLEDFVKGRIPVPKCLDGDAYTVAGEALASDEAREKSVYGLAFRVSPQNAKDLKDFCHDDRMVLFGLTDYIRNNLTRPITKEEVDAAERFMSTAHAFGGALNFDRTVWDRVINEYDGYLPIKIEALPEGSTFYPNEIPVQVTSLDKGFGEVAALVEAHLVGMVSIASTRATMERHLLERMKEYAREDDPEASEADILFRSQLMIHDFGMRASSASEESEVLGKAHLLSFGGTDTFNAAYQAWVQNGEKRVGSSILALAHRIVQGHKVENNSYSKLRTAAGKGGIGSYVADCYDFHAAVSGPLLEMALEASRTDGGIIVDRPDSGDYLENVLFVVDTAAKAGLYTTQKNGRLAMTNSRFIQGDSVNWHKLRTIMDTLKEHNYSPMNCGIVGIGGWLRNTVTRDTLSVAYKLSAKGEELEPVNKLADTRIKISPSGPVYVLRGQSPDEPSVVMQYETGHAGQNALVTFYDGSASGMTKFKDPCLEAFDTLRERVIHGFDKASHYQENWSPEILRIQDETMRKHGRSLSDYKY